VNGFIAAWLAGEGIVVWRTVHHTKKLPVPGALLGVSILFGALALIADSAPPARPFVTMIAWGLDLAGLINVLPGGLYGQVEEAQTASATAQGETADTSNGTVTA
jgi:hypothetical protein